MSSFINPFLETATFTLALKQCLTVSILGCALLCSGCSPAHLTERLSSANNWNTQQKTKNHLIGLTINPSTASHNSLFIDVRTTAGEPVSGCNVTIKSLQQWTFKNHADVVAEYVAPGVYKIDTNLHEGLTEVNVAIQPAGQSVEKLRFDAIIDRPLAMRKTMFR